MDKRKLTKEDIDKVRNIEGFPIGTDEDIIALSDAPYYTACPNPFIEDFIRENGKPYDEATDDYHREPFAADVSEGKNDPIYNVHTYHTKVPYKAIMKYILHYTNPGDIVFDGFCGSGMLAFAAQMCGVNDIFLENQVMQGIERASWGTRKAIVSDLSPAASHITWNYNKRIEPKSFLRDARDLLQQCREQCGWMYETRHTAGGSSGVDLEGKPLIGHINYTIWSDVFVCPHCSNEFNYWDVAIDDKTEKVLEVFSCPCCGSSIRKRDCEYATTTSFDGALNKVVVMAKQEPVVIHYTYGGKRFKKKPDKNDMQLIDKISNMSISTWYPTYALPDGDKMSDPRNKGIEYIHQYYTKRNLIALSIGYSLAKTSHMRFLLTAIMKTMSKMFRWAPHGKHTAGMPGTLFFPSVTHEYPIFDPLERRIKIAQELIPYAEQFGNDVIVSCGSLAETTIPNNSVDYIFTDPPFGANLNYSELSYLWESWLKVHTNTYSEAIISQRQNKKLADYQLLMERCFKEYYRVLKPGRWMTVEFHNSQNSVWNAIQEALNKAGFIVADVRTLDKNQSSFNQVKGASQAIKQDLVISAYKPKEKFVKEFTNGAGTEETAWAFVQQHLENIPVVVLKNNKIELIAERQAYLLFDRMVAYHIMQGIPVPMDATDFYRGLDEKFLKRDGMYFLPSQINEYDTARIQNDIEPIQFSLLVTNEKTAIAWLYQQLNDEPKTYAEIQPKFMQEVKAVDRFEQMPELSILLEQNFLQDEKGRWYVPDVTKEADLVKLREKNLWKEFEGYLASKGKLKLFRSEAIRVGFARLWKEKRYQEIVDMAERLPEQTIQEDPNLLMYYDISLSRVE
jgi:DNA modification methylase